MSGATALLLLRVVDLLATGVTLLPEVKAKFEAGRDKLAAILAEGRDPTPEEFLELLGESQDLTDRLREALAAKRAAEGDPE